MAHGKDVLDILTAVGTVAAAMAAAFAVHATRQVAERQEMLTSQVAEGQEMLTKRQLKQDLFDKRYAVFAAVPQYIEFKLLSPPGPLVLGDESPGMAERNSRADELSYILAQHQFLFGQDVASFLTEIDQKLDEYQEYQQDKRSRLAERPPPR